MCPAATEYPNSLQVSSYIILKIQFCWNIGLKIILMFFCLFSEQLAEIKKVTFSSIICNNNDGTIANIQPKSFFAADL